MSSYLDHAASTSVRPEAIEVIVPLLARGLGNPSGAHGPGRAALVLIDDAREQMSEILGCEPGELIFTSGGTEADNLAIIGASMAQPGGRFEPGTVICSAIEHHAVLRPCASLDATVAPVNRDGCIDLDRLLGILKPDTRLVSMMLVNNEVGSIQPLAEIGTLIRELAPTALFHTDAVQGAASMDLSELRSVVDMISISAHKFGGPPGVGALVVRSGTRIAPLFLGGSQERGRRAGTPAVALIAGMAKALSVTASKRFEEKARVSMLRDRLGDGLIAKVNGLIETLGPNDPSIASKGRDHKASGFCHVTCPGVNQVELLFVLDQLGVAASAGSSCESGALEPSHVLTAMGIPQDEACSAVRFSLGHSTTEAEIEYALDAIPNAIAQLQS